MINEKGMKETFTIANYVNIWRSDESGVQGELVMEAQIRRKICVGKSFVASTVERLPKHADLGIVERGSNYHKGKSVLLKTTSGWYLVADNGQEAIYGEPVEWSAIFGDKDDDEF